MLRRSASLVLLLCFAIVLALLSAALAAAIVSRGCLQCFRCHSGATESFESQKKQEEISFADLPVVEGVDGRRYDRIEILDGSKHELGWCLSIDGRIQMCQADSDRYHEMLILFACAVYDLRPTIDKATKASAAMIVYGGDGLALAVASSTERFKRIAVLEDEGNLSDLSATLGTQEQKKSEVEIVRYDGNVKQSLARHWPASFDLIVLDLKDRFPADGRQPPLTKATCRQLARLLTPGGILSVGSMLPNSSDWSGGVEGLGDGKCLSHRLPFTFYSEVRSGHVKMELFADWDMSAAISKAPQSPPAFTKGGSTFFDRTKPLSSYIAPWVGNF